jgi:hypothetical protein
MPRFNDSSALIKFGLIKITSAFERSKLKENDISVGDDQYRFQTTQWSAVLLSAQSQAPGFQAVLSALYKIYWYPLRSRH